MRKEEIAYLYNHYCKHGHRFIEHPKCISQLGQNNPLCEKLGFLDIETTGLKGTYAYVLSYCIKEDNGKILGRHLTKREIHSETYDKNLLKELINDMRKFDKLVTYYGGDYRFDLPILRTRALYWGLDFPLYKEIKGVDLYSIVKKKFNLHSNKLGVVCDFFGIQAKGHPMNPRVWFGANAGNERNLEWVFTHNKEDVCSTEKLYHKIFEYDSPKNSSI